MLLSLSLVIVTVIAVIQSFLQKQNILLLKIVDEYTKMVLTSWPATILTLGLVLLITQQEAIAKFIEERLISVGPDGIRGKSNDSTEDLVLLSKQNISSNPSEEIMEESSNNTSTHLPPSPDGKEALIKNNNELIKYLDFERIYNVIFGTQITILDALRKDPTNGILFTSIASSYEQWRQNDELLKKYSLNDYLQFLINAGLVDISESNNIRKYLIRDKGIEFLDYIEKNGYIKSKEH